MVSILMNTCTHVMIQLILYIYFSAIQYLFNEQQGYCPIGITLQLKEIELDRERGNMTKGLTGMS